MQHNTTQYVQLILDTLQIIIGKLRVNVDLGHIFLGFRFESSSSSNDVVEHIDHDGSVILNMISNNLILEREVVLLVLHPLTALSTNKTKTEDEINSSSLKVLLLISQHFSGQ